MRCFLPAVTMVAATLATFGLAGCTTESPSATTPSATAQLLTAAAADTAARQLSLAIPPDKKIYIDTTAFDGNDGAYAVGAIEAALLHRGDTIVDSTKKAAVVVDLLDRTLGIDNNETLLGIPATQVPMPLATSFAVPKIALYDNERELGVASFRALTVNASTGALISDSQPVYGYSHSNQYTVLLLFSWRRDDLIPPADRDKGISPIP